MTLDQTLPELTGSVLWLIPSEPYASFYRKEIERLSVRYETTRFESHLTLGRFAGVTTKQQKPEFHKSLFSTFGDNISLTNSRIECRNSAYQNLIHVLKSNHDLDMLQSELQKLITGYQPQEDYHVSLMCGDIPCRGLDSEISDLSKRLPEQVSFSKISAIKLDGQPDSWRTIWVQEF